MSSSTENTAGDGEQHRNKRVRRACLNCRRKKTRCHESMQGKSRLSSRAANYDKDDTSYGGLIARVAQLEEMARLPVKSQTPTSAELQGGHQAIDNFHASNSWVPPSSSVVDTSPSAGVESTRSLGCSETFFPLSPRLIQKAIDAFFLHSHNQPYSFFCESRLRQRALERNLPDHVLYAVVASAARFMEDQYSKSNLGALCAQMSWDLLLKHLHSDTEADLSFVQATTLLALFDFTDFKSRSAWKKIGAAARIAQDLKFMFEPSSFLDLQEQEEQRRTFWSIYMLDGLTTCGRARPPAFHGHYCKTNLPCTELSFQLGLYEETQNLDQALSADDITARGTNFSPFARVILIATILSRASQYVMQDINFRAERPPWDSDSDYAAISSSLFNFEYQVGIHRPLQEAFGMDGGFTNEFGGQPTEHIVFYYALYHLTQCILNHHFLLRRRLQPYSSRVPPIFTSRAFNTCLEHAQSLTLLLEDAHRLGCRLRASFLGYCALVVGTINSLHQFDVDFNVRLKSKQALDKNIEFLTRHAQYWNNAKLMLEELQNFDQEAVHLQSLISPEIIELNFDPDTIERLYDIADYNVISRYRAKFDVSIFVRDDTEFSGIPAPSSGYSAQWMQSLSGSNPTLLDGTELSGSHISWVPDHNAHYTSHTHLTMPEIGMQPQINQGMPEVMSDQLLL
ncbi:hypothetical protein DL98DRAFT_623127 [Cadophora sp. DSE1049]|nr:hypothetical protein DL98DRAFT_623127 [Cadophora sp. DSE1049]